MKKIGLFSLLMCFGYIGSSLADQCVSGRLHLNWTQGARDDEFIFSRGATLQKYYEDVDRSRGLNGIDLKDIDTPGGIVLEADSQLCKEGTIVVLDYSGWGRGTEYNGGAGQVFYSYVGAEDTWQYQNAEACSDGEQVKKIDYFYKILNPQGNYSTNNTEYFFRQNKKNDHDRVCICGGKYDTVYDANTGTCKTKAKPVVVPPQPPVRPGNKTCEQLYVGNQDLIDCCNQEKQGLTILDKNTKVCSCKDPTKEWKDGKCVAKDGGHEEEQPASDKKCTYTFSGEFYCSNGTKITTNKQIDVDPAKYGKKDCNNFTALINADRGLLNQLVAEYCSVIGGETVGPAKPQGPDPKLVEAAINSLNSFFQSAQSDASVWKNSEGKFNTTRLASDLTAGVVLGTVGGVVSGVVIKKKQVEKGFDALHCTVGGQRMADWGDQFQVNFRR